MASKKARVKRLTIVQKKKDEFQSRQIGKDPFSTEAYQKGLQEPPYPLEQLVWLAEMHPAHAACIEQRATDVVGGGWTWEPKNPEDLAPQTEHRPAAPPTATEPPTPNPSRTEQRETAQYVYNARTGMLVRKDHLVPRTDLVGPGGHQDSMVQERDRIDETLMELAGEEQTLVEILHRLWLDYTTCAIAYLEVVRDPQGNVRRVYHVPAHTIRAHKDGIRFCQARGRDKVWFTRWNSGERVDFKTGESAGEDATGDSVGSELLVFRKTTRRSDFYGIPNYVASVGWIMLALAARDYNINFFKNLREPRWAVILSNLDEEEDDGMMDEVEKAFTEDLSDQHRNLILQFIGEAKATFQKLSEDMNDMSFVRLLEMCDEAVFLGHRVPPDRVGLVKTGPLGGSVAETTNRVYRESVVVPDQELLANRLQRFLEVEFGELNWVLTMVELDAKAERTDLDAGMKGYRAGLFTLNEARARAGLPPILGETGDMFIWELDPNAARAIKSEEASKEVTAASVAEALLREGFAERIKAIDDRFAGVPN